VDALTAGCHVAFNSFLKHTSLSMGVNSLKVHEVDVHGMVVCSVDVQYMGVHCVDVPGMIMQKTQDFFSGRKNSYLKLSRNNCQPFSY
jgi:hypothetical protein